MRFLLERSQKRTVIAMFWMQSWSLNHHSAFLKHLLAQSSRGAKTAKAASDATIQRRNIRELPPLPSVSFQLLANGRLVPQVSRGVPKRLRSSSKSAPPTAVNKSS